jgi:DNA-binding NtrC family response regulator
MRSKADMPSILVLVPEEAVHPVARAATAAGLQVTRATGLSDFLERLARGRWSATLLSLSVEHVDERVARAVAERTESGRLLISTADVSLERALLARDIAASGLLREPFDEDELEARLTVVSDEGKKVRIPESKAAPEDDGRPVLLGSSPKMGAVFETVARVADSGATVLVTGESGTGKEIIARTLHWASQRARSPFVAVNCAAIPEHLLETELFGHERGAFTGAVARRVGRFERAHGGTLFLDEIGDMSLVLQAKVLRVLEDRTVERVGGEEAKAVDVRLVAATNQDLASATRQGRFREDLYHRLAVVEIQLPPLRERAADVRALALHFAADFARRHGKAIDSISEHALRRLASASWPGNVRELRNVMDRAVVLAAGPTIRIADLRLGESAPSAAAVAVSAMGAGYPPTFSLEEVEADHIRRVLATVHGHIGRAAERLGIHRNTLTRKMKEHGFDPGLAAGA